jgi:hypothetical protein
MTFLRIFFLIIGPNQDAESRFKKKLGSGSTTPKAAYLTYGETHNITL